MNKIGSRLVSQMRKEMLPLNVTSFNYINFSLGSRSTGHQGVIHSTWPQCVVSLKPVCPSSERDGVSANLMDKLFQGKGPHQSKLDKTVKVSTKY